MSKAVRLAIAGFGLVGRRHAQAIARSASAEVSCIIEPSETGRKLAAEQGLPTCPDLDSFFVEQDADGIILATPNTLHVEQAYACVSRGLPVLVEKPIATESKDATGLVQAAETAGVPLLVGHHRRHNPLIQRAKSLIEDGAIGDIRALHATCWFYKPDDYFNVAEWRRKPGAGPIPVNLVHDVDLIRYLCGDVATVCAAASPSARGYENEDVASALLEFENGAIGTITVSDSIVAPWSWELTSRENPIYPPTPENCYMIGGSHGSLTVPDLKLWHYANGTRDWWSAISATSQKLEATDPLINQIDNFAAVIREGAAPTVTGQEGLKSLQVVEAIQRSAKSGARVILSSKWQEANGKAVNNI